MVNSVPPQTMQSFPARLYLATFPHELLVGANTDALNDTDNNPFEV